MASYLRTVAGSSSSNTSSNDLGKRIAKWALIIGVPTAVCVAAYLVYRHQQEQAKKSATRRSPLPTPLTKPSGDNTTTTTDQRPKVIIIFDLSIQFFFCDFSESISYRY
jgi:MFS superfamily sulfate permease-like transporter